MSTLNVGDKVTGRKSQEESHRKKVTGKGSLLVKSQEKNHKVKKDNSFNL